MDGCFAGWSIRYGKINVNGGLHGLDSGMETSEIGSMGLEINGPPPGLCHSKLLLSALGVFVSLKKLVVESRADSFMTFDPRGHRVHSNGPARSVRGDEGGASGAQF